MEWKFELRRKSFPMLTPIVAAMSWPPKKFRGWARGDSMA
jgi:hypothetical protein